MINTLKSETQEYKQEILDLKTNLSLQQELDKQVKLLLVKNEDLNYQINSLKVNNQALLKKSNFDQEN